MKRTRQILRRGLSKASWSIRGVPRIAIGALNSYGFNFLAQGYAVGPSNFVAMFSRKSVGEELLPSLEKLEEIIAAIPPDEMKEAIFEMTGFAEKLLRTLRGKAKESQTCCPNIICEGGSLAFQLKHEPEKGEKLIRSFIQEIARFTGT